MSLASLLLAFAPAIAARFNPVPELEAENKRLKAELIDVKADLEHLHVARERLGRELLAERERAGLWRNEALRLRNNDLLPMPMGGQHALPQQHAQNAMAQPSQQQAQNMQQQAYSQGLAGMQQTDWPHCDCSPSRSRALLG